MISFTESRISAGHSRFTSPRKEKWIKIFTSEFFGLDHRIDSNPLGIQRKEKVYRKCFVGMFITDVIWLRMSLQCLCTMSIPI